MENHMQQILLWINIQVNAIDGAERSEMYHYLRWLTRLILISTEAVTVHT